MVRSLKTLGFGFFFIGFKARAGGEG